MLAERMMGRHAAERMMERPAPQGTVGRRMLLRRGRRRGLLRDSATDEAYGKRSRGKDLDHGAIPLSWEGPEAASQDKVPGVV
jgi:hypothetical protein